MANQVNRGSVARCVGWALGIGTAVGALAGWIMVDLNKPQSTVRHWIEVGGRRKDRKRLVREMEAVASEAAAAIEIEIIEANRVRERQPPQGEPGL